jgi:hypothetical protein
VRREVKRGSVDRFFLCPPCRGRFLPRRGALSTEFESLSAYDSPPRTTSLHGVNSFGIRSDQNFRAVGSGWVDPLGIYFLLY